MPIQEPSSLDTNALIFDKLNRIETNIGDLAKTVDYALRENHQQFMLMVEKEMRETRESNRVLVEGMVDKNQTNVNLLVQAAGQSFNRWLLVAIGVFVLVVGHHDAWFFIIGLYRDGALPADQFLSTVKWWFGGLGAGITTIFGIKGLIRNFKE